MADPIDQEYDQQTFKIIELILKNDSCCIDVGAHTGKVLSKILDLAPKGKHFAFEPLPNCANSLRKNFPGVNIFQIALANRVGITDFQWIKNAQGYSGIKLRHTPMEPEVEIITVKMDMMDNLIPPNVDIAFIKIDVEGGEYNVLKGSIKTIERCKPVIIFECGVRALSLYEHSFNDIYRLLVERCGLKISTMKRWLQDKFPYTQEEFVRGEHRDYMWIAYS